MKIDIKKLEKSKVEMKCEMPWQEFKGFYNEALESLAKQIKIDGFREGKVPIAMVEKKVGQASILEEAVNLAIEKKYPEILKDNNFEPIASPKAEILKLAFGNDFSFKITVEVLPEITLPDYKEITQGVEKKKIEVSDKEIDDTLLWLRKSRASFKGLDAPAKKGDFVSVEYSADEIEKGKSYKDNFTIGESHFAPGFEDNVIALKKGEEKEFSFTFPKDYFEKNIAGKKVSFKLKMLDVQEMILPELNEEFAQQLGGAGSVEELKASIKKGLLEEKQAAENKRWQDEVLEKIAQKADIEAPESMMLAEKERMINNLKQDIKANLQMEFEEYLEKAGKTEKEIDETFTDSAIKQIKYYLILRAIGEKENIEISDDEIKDKVERFLAGYPQAEKSKIDIDKIKSYYKGMEFNQKVFEKLQSF